MRLIKLDATDSTNDFLKGLASANALENYTVVTAETQSKGRGQMGAHWISEPGKNLTASVLLANAVSDIKEIFNLNIAVSLAVIAALADRKIPQLAVKWPNDIMSAGKKVGGILIENSIRADGTVSSVIGIGINVNQLNFEALPQATSLALIIGRQLDRAALLRDIISNLKRNISSSNNLRSEYIALLFKIGVPMPFESADGKRFMGVVAGISASGLLQLKLDDDKHHEYDLKQVKMLY